MLAKSLRFNVEINPGVFFAKTGCKATDHLFAMQLGYVDIPYPEW
jgi:hypothetical protein